MFRTTQCLPFSQVRHGRTVGGGVSEVMGLRPRKQQLSFSRFELSKNRKMGAIGATDATVVRSGN